MSGTWGRIDKRRDEERRLLAARLLDQGVPVKAIAGQLGVGLAWVRDVRKQGQTATDSDTAA